MQQFQKEVSSLDYRDEQLIVESVVWEVIETGTAYDTEYTRMGKFHDVCSYVPASRLWIEIAYYKTRTAIAFFAHVFLDDFWYQHAMQTHSLEKQ